MTEREGGNGWGPVGGGGGWKREVVKQKKGVGPSVAEKSGGEF